MKLYLMLLASLCGIPCTAADLSRTYDAMIGITPETRSFTRETGTGGIVTSGSGTWPASSPDSWISPKTPTASRRRGSTARPDWQRVTLPLTAPKTTVRWSFYRDDHDEVGAVYENAAWVDGMEVVPIVK